MRLFEGYEAEGRFRGVKTLFVSGDVPFEKIRNHAVVPENLAATCIRYGQIYFGADGCSAIDWDSVYKCTKILPIVSVELGQNNLPPSWEILLHSYVHPIINIQKFDEHALMKVTDALWGPNVQVKFSTENRNWLAPLPAFLQNRKSDIEKDKELWRLE